jgi:tRNA dimethylallyltransferase
MKTPKKPLLAVVGPTAAGKTAYGLQLARDQAGEIISVDSRQVYKFLSIGTAKPLGVWRGDVYEVEGIPYHVVDIWDPGEPFTAAEFVRVAQAKISEIEQRGHQPILVGGTGLYFKALSEGLARLPPRDEGLRSELRAIADSQGRAHLHAELAKVDPQAAARIPANNIQRVLRALEVHRLTGKPITEWHQEHQARRPEQGLTLKFIGIDPGPDSLKQRIAERSAAMLENGIIEETERLINQGYAPDCAALTGLGYPRVIAYLSDLLTKDQLLNALIQDTRQYAKRQRTWFRNQFEVSWKTS